MAITFTRDVPKHGFAEGDVVEGLTPESENHWIVRGAAVADDVPEPVAEPEPVPEKPKPKKAPAKRKGKR